MRAARIAPGYGARLRRELGLAGEQLVEGVEGVEGVDDEDES